MTKKKINTKDRSFGYLLDEYRRNLTALDDEEPRLEVVTAIIQALDGDLQKLHGLYERSRRKVNEGP